jgi:class 3 adenylate cyclase
LSEGQRTLAAILFTDTVDYSALMSRDEDRARRLVARDFHQMRAACARFDGQVLKSTGDGLLMLFNSAVQAVACAFEIQRDFREQNRTLPAAERLRHRIGIHLGDIIREHGDVMGDGVNIAARLQSESLPGGICISNTVYEVVQNRLPFSVSSRKAKKLKNVGSIVVFHISQNEGRYRYLDQAWDWVRVRRKRMTGIAIAIAAFSVAEFFSATKEPQLYHDELQESASQLNPLGSVSPLAAAEEDDDDDDSAFQTPIQKARPGATPATDEDFYIARFNNMKRYDFVAMHAWLETHDSPGIDADKLGPVLLSMQQLFAWCHAQLPGYSSTHPLVVHTEHEDLEFWAGPAGGITWKIHGVAANLAPDEVPPGVMAEMAAELIHEAAPPHATQTRQLWLGMEYFIASYRVLSDRLRRVVDAGARG